VYSQLIWLAILRWCGRKDTTQVTELIQDLGTMEVDAPGSGKSRQAYAEYKTQSLPSSLFRVIGLGLGIAGLCIIALTLVLSPVLVVEPNLWIRIGELFWIGVGVAALLVELFGAKR
jgi:hypothetical protein